MKVEKSIKKPMEYRKVVKFVAKSIRCEVERACLAEHNEKSRFLTSTPFSILLCFKARGRIDLKLICSKYTVWINYSV